MSKKYKNFLFDADGTLFDTSELICKCFQNTAGHFKNIELRKEDVLRHIGMTLRDQMNHHFGLLDDVQFELYREFHMNYQKLIYPDYLRIFDGVEQTLAALKKCGKSCAVVTSRTRPTLELYLKETGIMHYFDVLVTPEMTQKHKPDPEPALKAVELLQDDPSSSLFIGDALFDMECGVRAGMDTAFVSWSRINPESLGMKPVYLINRPEELLNF